MDGQALDPAARERNPADPYLQALAWEMKARIATGDRVRQGQLALGRLPAGRNVE